MESRRWSGEGEREKSSRATDCGRALNSRRLQIFPFCSNNGQQFLSRRTKSLTKRLVMESILSDRIRPMFQEATFNQDWLLMITTAIAGTVDGGPINF